MKDWLPLMHLLSLLDPVTAEKVRYSNAAKFYERLTPEKIQRASTMAQLYMGRRGFDSDAKSLHKEHDSRAGSPAVSPRFASSAPGTTGLKAELTKRNDLTRERLERLPPARRVRCPGWHSRVNAGVLLMRGRNWRTQGQ